MLFKKASCSFVPMLLYSINAFAFSLAHPTRTLSFGCVTRDSVANRRLVFSLGKRRRPCIVTRFNLTKYLSILTLEMACRNCTYLHGSYSEGNINCINVGRRTLHTNPATAMRMEHFQCARLSANRAADASRNEHHLTP
jgi:hypothetical protein